MSAANHLSFWRQLFRRTKGTRAGKPVSKRNSFQPRIDPLEERILLSTFDVINLKDNGAGSLPQAIVDANANPGPDSIRFADDVRGTITVSEQLMITDDLTINGPGANELTVSGGEATRVFAVLPAGMAANPLVLPTVAQLATSPEVRINKLAIEDGSATDALGFSAGPANPGFAFGGGLYNLGGTVHLNGVRMASNEASGVVTAGGGLANEFGGTARIRNSHFEDNLSDGGLIGAGGAMTSDLGPTADAGPTGAPTVTIDRSWFTGNTAVAAAGYIDGVGFSGLGGGGAVLNLTGSMSISGSHFEDNTAQGGSGAVPGSTSGGPGFGGAINSGDASPFGVGESNLKIGGSTFVGNHANGGGGGETDVPGGVGAGGAIFVVNGGDAELHRNHFRGNEVAGGVGGENANGGLANGGGVSGAGGASLTLKRNTFADNAAEGGAGTGSGAGAAGRGGGLALQGVELTGFAPGPATGTVLGDRYNENVARGGAGGGIYNEGELEVKNVRLSHNQARGKADVVMDFASGYVFQGVAIGGGLSNLGTIDVSGTTFHGNKAVGADGAEGLNVLTLPAGTAIPTYPGIGVGGGLHNIEQATVSRSRFIANEARGGDNNQGSFPGVATGAGIYNDGWLHVNGSRFQGNVSTGGDNNLGDINAGSGFGGGIASGSVTALAGLRSASLQVEHSWLYGNEARGGDGNSGIPLPFAVPPAHAPSGGLGGGIVVYQGTAEISKTSIIKNRATGGDDSYGIGGGVFFFGFVGTVDAEMSRSLVFGNAAIGGNGADGMGGGVAMGSLGSLFAADVDVKVNATIDHTVVSRNLAQGGRGTGGSGGDGLGGGIFIDPEASLELSDSLVVANRARGGPGGEGVGGGIYNLGELERIRALIFANWASTSDDNCFGC